MLKEAVFHLIDSSYAYTLTKDTVLIKLRTKKNDLQEVNLGYYGRYQMLDRRGENILSMPMKKVASDQLFDYYEAVLQINILGIGYFFELVDEQETLYYANYQFMKHKPYEYNHFFILPTMAEKDMFIVPEWAKESIVYQIFPERFYNGDASNDPKETEAWDSKVTAKTMLGGDLQGIIDKLDYIADLGVNTIYMTPIFEAGSNHKYNTYDYFKIDPQFGTLETFKELVKKAHEKNIRVILDAVFNHCGVHFAPFQDVLQNGEKSSYKEWFDIKKFPVELKTPPDFSCFGYFWGMPKLMTKNPEVMEYLLNVATYWIKEADIDGWRLDVANEVDHHFWREFRKAVKAVKPDAMIIGEVWHETNTWLQGDQYDSTMNYLFRDAVRDFIAFENITVEEFDARLGFFRGLYKLQAYDVLWNLIDSHDTARFLTLSDEHVSKLKLAALFQMTFTGVPFIYYGDEVGMSGEDDPDCRRGMLWKEEHQNQDVLTFYKKLISIRKACKCMQQGTYETLLIDNENRVYGFRRQYGEEVIDVYINNGYTANEIEVTADGETITDLLMDHQYQVEYGKAYVRIPKKSAVILKQ